MRATADANASQRALIEDSDLPAGSGRPRASPRRPVVAQFVRALLEGGEKVLLFAHHHEVMDIYKRELKSSRPGFITGRETRPRRRNAGRRAPS